VLEKNSIVFLGPEEINDLIAERMIKAKRGLTVIASNIRHASIMRSQGGQDVYLVGGRIDSNTGIVYGSFAEDMISSMISDIAIFGCKSINPQKGIIFETDLESQILSKVKSFSRKIILIADHTQFLEDASGSILKFDKSMTIFSDDEVKPKFINELKSSGINIIQAKHLTRESLYEAN